MGSTLMKQLLIFLALTACAWSQPTMPFAMWKSAAAAPTWTPYALGDTARFWGVAADVADSLGKADGDTTYILPNRARFTSTPSSPAYQLVASKKPVYRDSAWAKALRFDGSDDFMLVAQSSTTQPYTVAMVLRVYRLNQNGNAWLSSTTGVYHATDSRFRLYYYPSETTSGTTVSINTTYVVIAVYDGVASAIRVNGASTSANAGTVALANWGIGANSSGGFPASIAVAEVVYLTSANAATVVRLEQYLASKFGVTLP